MELNLVHGCTIRCDGDVIRYRVIVIEVVTIDGKSGDRGSPRTTGLRIRSDDVSKFIHTSYINIDRINLADVMELDFAHGRTVGSDRDVLGSLIVVVDIISIERLSRDSCCTC